MKKMNILHNKSFREKIIIITMLITGFSLLIVSALFMANEFITYRYTLAQELSNIGKLIGENAKTAVATGDRKAANKILDSLKHHSNIVTSYIYTDTGEIFTYYPKRPIKGLGFLPKGQYLDNNHIHTYDTILYDGKPVGTVYLQSNLQKLYDRLFVFGRILVAVVLCTFLFALQVSKSLHRVISDPILYLAEIAKRVSNNKDYSIRAKKQSDDEVGILTNTFNEMLSTIEKAQKKLFHEANHDSLTGLPNRSLLIDRIDRLIQYSKRQSDNQFAIIFLDLDRFKLVNDSLGHFKGDEMLKQFSKRLTSELRDVDTVARLGGDEFIILLNQLKHSSDTILVADRIQKIASLPFILDDQMVTITASMGIAYNKKEYAHASEIIRDADNAMYSAKSLGKARYQIFDKKMHIDAMNTLKSEISLRKAIKEKEFVLYYQPIYSIKSKKLSRLEALIRWQHPQRGLILPGEFIPLAEETGLIVDIGKTVFDMVCKRISLWQKKGIHIVETAINFSAMQFEQKGLVKFLKENIDEKGVDPSSLNIEITENVAIHDLKKCVRLMNEIKDIGIRFSLDDFGTGFSSLSFLNAIPVNYLKIDKSLIKFLSKNKKNKAITKSIITMSHDLGFTVIAEGVETKTQLDILRKYGCDEAQGYLLNRPMPVEEIEKIL